MEILINILALVMALGVLVGAFCILWAAYSLGCALVRHFRGGLRRREARRVKKLWSTVEKG